MSNEEQELPPAVGPADDDRAAALTAICDVDPAAKWARSEGPRNFGAVRWAPDLVGKDDRVLHLSLSGELPRAYQRRMTEAAVAGAKVTFATGASGLEIETLVALQTADARLVVLEQRSSGLSAVPHRSVADWIALQGIALNPEDLVKLVEQRLEAATQSGVNAARGRWFEEALCLLFSHVSWLRVDEHSYRNETEEIDIVMSAHVAGYLAQLAGGPIVLATAKNEAKATGSDVVKYLKEQMANRKGRCKLGFLCSASTVSDDALKEILRGSQANDAVIVPLGRARIERLLRNAEELDEEVEKLIRRAIAD